MRKGSIQLLLALTISSTSGSGSWGGLRNTCCQGHRLTKRLRPNYRTYYLKLPLQPPYHYCFTAFIASSLQTVRYVAEMSTGPLYWAKMKNVTLILQQGTKIRFNPISPRKSGKQESELKYLSVKNKQTKKHQTENHKSFTEN